jgi:hypothetical protein
MDLGRTILRFLVFGAISADWSEQIELDQTVLPGISIRF